jgi:hypothetical protein
MPEWTLINPEPRKRKIFTPIPNVGLSPWMNRNSKLGETAGGKEEEANLIPANGWLCLRQPFEDDGQCHNQIKPCEDNGLHSDCIMNRSQALWLLPKLENKV